MTQGMKPPCSLRSLPAEGTRQRFGRPGGAEMKLRPLNAAMRLERQCSLQTAAVGTVRSLVWVVVVGLAVCGATKARVGRPQRANPAVGPWGTDFPGLSASGARRPFSSVRCAHCAQRRRVSLRSSLRSPPPNHSSPAPPTRAAACPPAPLRDSGALRRTACHRSCSRATRTAGSVGAEGVQHFEGPHATALAGERLGRSTRRKSKPTHINDRNGPIAATLGHGKLSCVAGGAQCNGELT